MIQEDQTIEEQMLLALAGNRSAYARALEHTSRLLRPYLSKRLRNKSEVEDVLQEILLSIHKARHTYDGMRPYAPWAFAIARYRLSDYLRRHYADFLHYAGELTEAENSSQDHVTEYGLTYESLKEEIDLLPQKQAMILHMIHGEGYTAKEVAGKIGMKESAVKVSAHRAYKVLRKKLVQ